MRFQNGDFKLSESSSLLKRLLRKSQYLEIRRRLGARSKSCLPIFRGQEGIRDMQTCVKLEIDSFIHRNKKKNKGRTETDIQASLIVNVH